MAKFSFSLDAAQALSGTDLAIGRNRIIARTDLAIVSIAIPLGGENALAGALKTGWNLQRPQPTLASVAANIHAIQTGPDQFFLVFPHATPDAQSVVAKKLKGAGYTTDQTDVWAILEISGPDTIAALERICPLDIARFPNGGMGRTVMEHMGALILRLDDDRFLLFSASSSAASFLHAVETSYQNIQPV